LKKDSEKEGVTRDLVQWRRSRSRSRKKGKKEKKKKKEEK